MVADTFASAISGVTAAIQLFDGRTFGGPKVHDDNRPWVSSSLFIEMLRKGPNQIFVIDTVGKAGRWGIGLAGVISNRAAVATAPIQTSRHRISASGSHLNIIANNRQTATHRRHSDPGLPVCS
jgi:hypothetical protein